MRINCLLFLVLSLLVIEGRARNLGNYGEVFPVIEIDIRKHIMNRLHHMETTGELARYQKEVQQRISKHIIRPTPLGLPTTNQPVSFFVDPTVAVHQDIWAPNGVLVARAGTQLNPFDTISFSKTLFFFNGDDKHQVAWVQKHYKDYDYVKFILTGGDIRDGANRFGRIYFDLGGRLTTLLHIKHVPSVVHQEGRVWAIKEIGVFDA